MAREVSSNTANAMLEAGDYFGIPRDRLLRHFHNPQELDRRLGRVDWAEFLPVCREILKELGSGPELVPRGQEFLRYKFKTRNAHYYAQFTTWDKALWVTKHYMAGRMIRGYSVDYHKLGKDYFHVVMRLTEDLEGDADFLYFLTGVWTGSSTLANLDNRIENLKVTPNHCEADIQFDSRSFASRAVHNPLYCRWKTWRELRRDQKEQKTLITRMQKERQNLSSTMETVSDAVFDLPSESAFPDRGPSLPAIPPFLLRPEQAIERLQQIYQAGIQTEEELESTRTRLRTLFDAVSDGLFVFHRGNLKLTNREAERMMGHNDKSPFLHAVYEAGLRRCAARTDTPGPPESPEGFADVLVTSCTPLNLEEGRSYLIAVSDLSRARELSRHLEELSVRERKRIARDLHDGLSQLLSSLAFQAKAVSLRAKEEPEASDLARIAKAADNCLHFGAEVYHTLDKI